MVDMLVCGLELELGAFGCCGNESMKNLPGPVITDRTHLYGIKYNNSRVLFWYFLDDTTVVDEA